MNKEEKEEEEFDFYKEYPHNVLDAFIVLLILQAIIDKPIDFVYITKSSLVIGVLISVATYFNKEFKRHIQQGLHYSVSTMIINQFIPIL